MSIRRRWLRRRVSLAVLPLLVALVGGAPSAAAQNGALCGVALAISPQSQRGLPGATVTFSYRATVTVAQVEAVQISITSGGNLPTSVSPGSHALSTTPLADPQTYGVEGSISATVPADAAAGTAYELVANQAVAACSTTNGGTLTGSSGGPALSIVVAQLDPTATSTSTATSTATATATATSTPTATSTATPSPSPSATATSSPTASPTATGTATATVTSTATGTSTASPTATSTGTLTPTPTGTLTASPSPSPTGSATATGSATGSVTPSASASPTSSATGSAPASPTRASTATGTATSGTGTASPQHAITTATPGTPANDGQPANGQRLDFTQSTTSAPESAGGAGWPRFALGFLGLGLASAGGYALWRGRQRPI